MSHAEDETGPLLAGAETRLKNFSGDDADKHKGVDMSYNKTAYWIMMLLGVGLLLPWNVALNSLDYISHNFPHVQLPYYVTLAYVYPQLPLLAVMVKVRWPLWPACVCDPPGPELLANHLVPIFFDI
jgi:hypothetical protein